MKEEQLLKMAEQVKKHARKRYLDFDDCWGYRRKQG